MTPLSICIVSGTNRADSRTRRVAGRLAQDYAAAGARAEAAGGRPVTVTLLDLTELPPALFTPQAYAEKPSEFKPFSDAILAADGVVVITPEYNGGFSGALKMFIDHLPFPAAFEDRAVAFVGLGDGVFGGLRPIEQLAQVFTYRNARLFNRRVVLPQVSANLRDDDRFGEPLTEQLLGEQTVGFLKFCGLFATEKG